jgi:deoxyribose-phosphate aldolase
MNIAERIEHTMIDARSTKADILNLCQDAIKYNFRSVCLNPEWSHLAKEKLHGTGIKIVTVYNFPTSKSNETKYSDEIDILIQARGCLTPQGKKNLEKQLKQIEQFKFMHSCPVKVVIETRILTKKEVIYISRQIAKHRIDYIKSSTGLYNRLYEQLYLQAKDEKAKELITKTYSSSNFEDLKLIKKGLTIFGIPRKYFGLFTPKIKISGGIKYYKDAENLIREGADLLGASRSVAIIKQQETENLIKEAKNGKK